MPPMETAIPGRPSPPAGRTLIARVPGRPNRKHFPKEDFPVLTWRRAPAPVRRGMLPGESGPPGLGTGPDGRTHQLKSFRFDGAVCGVCPLRSQCVAGSSGLGRTVQLHPQEALLQQARALQQSEAFRRVPAAPRGWWNTGWRGWSKWGSASPARFGRTKTKFQLYLVATVANLTLVAAEGRSASRHRRRYQCRQVPSVPGPSVPPLILSLRGSVKS